MPELIDATEIMFTPFEPKTKNRFVMYIESIPAYLIKTANRPQITFEEIVLDHINVKRYIKGKAAQAVMEWVRLSHESVTGRDGYSDFYKKDVTFNMLGPVGDVVEEWTLKGAWVQDANFNDLDFASNDPADIELQLRYDYAILQF